MTAMFQFKNLSFGYTATPVLRDISVCFSSGEFIALVGPNGAGKSTLLKIMAGLIRGYTGVAQFSGQGIGHYSPAALARKMAFVPQETHMAFPFTVAEIVMMGRLPHSNSVVFDRPQDAAIVDDVMTMTDTAALSAKVFQKLSGGERQRVVLASALAQNPEVLLLDEPTVYLDMKHQIQFYEILERLNAERGMTIVSVTHDLNLAARYAGRIIALRDGRFVADGLPDEVLTPQHVYEIFEIHAAVLKRPDGRGSYIIPTS